MGVFIQASDLTSLTTDEQDETTVEKWISKAELRLRRALARRGCDLDQLLVDEPARVDVIKDVLENAVLRVLRNPEGLRSESEDGYSYTANPLDASGNIWFPDSDLDDVAPRPRTQVGTINLALPAHRRGVW